MVYHIRNQNVLITNLATMTAAACLTIIVSVLAVTYILGLQIIPERANVVAINAKFASNVSFFIKRYHRRGDYYINLDGTNHQVWNNNVTAHFVFYEFLHNEYKRSFVEMHFKYCDLVKRDPYIGRALAAAGGTCPLIAGPKKVRNISIAAHDFPHVWPFERCKVDIRAHQTSTEELMGHLELYLLFKQKANK